MGNHCNVVAANLSQPAAAQLPAAKTLNSLADQKAGSLPDANTPPAAPAVSLAAAQALPDGAAAQQLEGEQDGIPLTSIAQAAPELQSFIDSVANNHPDQVVGVFVPGRFALPVLQQPGGDINYITPFDGALTQYGPPLEHDVISLLAHNFLAGRVFFNLRAGDQVTLVYGDGRLANFAVASIDTYQALSPLDPYSAFIDQADPAGKQQTFQQVYDRYYTTGGQVVFQTCVEKNGDLSWGRIFVVARRLN